MDTTSQISGVSKLGVTSYVNTIPHVNGKPQFYTAQVPVEDSSAIIIHAAMLKGIKIIPADEYFNYPITEWCDSITKYTHVRKEEAQAQDSFRDIIMISLDNIAVIEDGQTFIGWMARYGRALKKWNWNIN